jgi:16S rRNA processing protein RimM
MSMPPVDGLLEVGRVGRAHGVKGGVIVTLGSDRRERVTPGARLHDGSGWRTVVVSRPLPPSRHVVVFDGVADRNTAELLAGRTLWGEPIDDPDALWVHELIGAEVIDQHDIVRGRCVAVIENPANDLLELDTGHLVPVTFVISNDVSVEGAVVRVDAPDGLFDLLD